MTREDFLESPAEFDWNFCSHFLVQTKVGNFIWDDPDYGGDNTFKYVGKMTIKQFCKEENIPFVRSKGQHIISRYCGSDIKIIGYEFENEFKKRKHSI